MLGRWAALEADGLVDHAGLAEARIRYALTDLPAQLTRRPAQRPADQEERGVAWRSPAGGAALEGDAAASGMRPVAETDDGQQCAARIAQPEPQAGIARGPEMLVAQDERPGLATVDQLHGAGPQPTRVVAYPISGCPAALGTISRGAAARLKRSSAAVPTAPVVKLYRNHALCCHGLLRALLGPYLSLAW